MRTLKSYFLYLPVIMIFFLSCSRDESDSGDETGDPVVPQVAVLSLQPVLNNMMKTFSNKQGVTNPPECSGAVPAYAQLALTYGESEIPVDVTVDILGNENGFFTAYDDELEIPIPAGSSTVSVTITDFVVWSEGSPGEIIWAAPKIGSVFAEFVNMALPISENLQAGSKTYLEVPVICFDDRQVNLYGYFLFDLNIIEVSSLCFFANYCADDGRHYTANYSLDLYLGTSNAGTPLYMDQTPTIGLGEHYYAKPICLAVPAPGEGISSEEPYLYYEISIKDWEGNYGTAGGYKESGTLSWNEVQALLNNDGTTAEYEHLFINCEEDDNLRDTNILLTVDTQNINEDNLDTTVIFTDDRSNPTGNPGDAENFTSLVDRGMKVYWRGQTKDGNNSVVIDILEIERKPDGGSNILESTFKEDGLVVGQVTNEYVSGLESYYITFRIINGRNTKTFTIDPKLKMTGSN